jgi:hypothetical protein
VSSLTSLLALLHLVGIVLATGAATAKWTLLLRSRSDPAFLPVFLGAARPVTRLIIVGQVLATLTGITWLVLGYALAPLLVAKLVLVGAVWILGPVIDNVVEPRFRALAPAPGDAPSPAFLAVQRRYLLLETAATGIFYAIIVMWMLG